MKSLGIIIPFLNEEKALESVVCSLVTALDTKRIPYKVLLVNDGSSDNSPKIADRLAANNLNISVIHKEFPANIGSAYKDGIRFFETDLICWLPSDGEVPAKAVIDCYSSVNGTNRPCISYPINTFRTRSLLRAFLSKAFQWLCRLVFKVPIKYFNGVAVYNKKAVEELNLISNGFTINLELAIKYALKNQVVFEEVPFLLNERIGGEEKALKVRNVLNVIKFLFFLKLQTREEGV